MDPDRENGDLQFGDLNWLGKTVLLSGQVARAAGSLIEAVVDQAAGIIVEAEKAFREGMDPNVEDAKILEEYEDR